MNRTAVICISIAGAIAGTSACAAGTASTAPVLSSSKGSGQAYPTKPVRMIVPSIAGGNADIQARYIAERLSEALGKQFVVDNRGGAAGIIGIELAARAPADGYTVMLVANTFTVAPSLFSKLPYDSVRDFQPVSLVGDTPLLFIGNTGLPANSVKDVIALAKSRPGQLNYGTTGVGSPSHLGCAMFELMAGVKLVHVPYKGMPAATLGVMTGQIQLGLPSVTSALQHVKAGKVKAFAISTKSRSALVPDIPTMDEAGVPGYEMSIWNGMVVPRGTPKAIVNRLHETIVQILRSREAQERYANVGAEIRYNSPEEFQTLIRAETAKWAKVIQAAGIRMDQ